MFRQPRIIVLSEKQVSAQAEPEGVFVVILGKTI
jgi:hypothetical protein